MWTSPFLGPGLAAQHRQALLDRADARRLYRMARADRTAAGAVHIRPIRADDEGLLLGVFARLGPESRRRRFLGPKTALTPRELRYLADVDHHDHEALVAVSRQDGSGLGVARFIRDRDDFRTAELAVTVVDEWQSHGIGTRLVTELSDRARTEGVTRFTALMLVENTGAKRLLEHLPGTATLLERERDVLSYHVEIADQPVASAAR